MAIFCVAGLLAGPPAFPLDPAKRVDQYTLEVWPFSALLGAKTVFSILQTRDGYLWLASNGGLLRFDGFRFVLFEPANTPAFSAIEVRALLETSDGSLWIGIYGGGVVRLREGRFEQFGEQQGLPSLLVRSLADGGDGSVWVGTHGGGVARLKDGLVVERITRADGLPGDEVRSLLFSRRGDLWIGTERGGLSRRRAGRLRSWTPAEGLGGDTVTALQEDAGGDLWVATTRGLQLFESDGRILKTYGLADGLASSYVFSLGQDRQGNLWVGTGGGGLSRFTGGRFANLAADGGLPSDYVWAFYEDRAGSLWVGSEGGLIRLKDSPFTMWGARQGLAADQVHGLLEDRDGAIWLAGTKGLSRFEDGRVTAVLGTADGLPSEVTRSLLEARDGALWVSTDGDGVARLAAGAATVYTEKDGLGDDLVWSLAEDREGTIWAATQNRGVSRFAAGKWSVLSKDEGLGANSVRVLLADRDGDVWAGTMGGGLSRLRGNRVVKTYTSRDGLGGDSILCLYQDPDGHLWVGTQSNGLSLFANGRFTSFDRRRGFFADGIGSIAGDDRGHLWFSAKGGPFRVARRELLDLFEKGAAENGAAGRADALGAIGLGKSGGLLGSAGTGFTPAVWKTRDGRLLYPTSKGMGVIDPQKVEGPPRPSPPIFESLLANHRDIALSPPPVLPAGTFALDIHYTAPSLEAPERIRFRYWLEGYDRDWTEVGERRVAYYPNLPPGRYLFRVAAGDISGSWGESAALPVVLLPYFYQTWWFKASLVGLGVWALYGLYRLRAGRLETRAAVAEERNRLAREIHDTIAQDLAAILMHARVGRRGSDAPFLEDIEALATNSLSEARRSLQALRPPALDGKNLAQALRDITRSLAAGSGVEIVFRAECAQDPAPAVEDELLRIAKEALANALRHGGAKKIEVELRCGRDEVVLLVADDGAGFDPESAFGGFGLIGMRERAAALGGTLELRSAPSAGARIEVRAPAKGREP